MQNIYKLIWANEALLSLKEIIEYLEANWTQTEIKKFARLLDKHLNLLLKNPFLYPKDPALHNLRKAVISKQVSIFYRITSTEIHIISLFDNRQNPQKMRK
ncbi:type II toxin-antitoxin system RelE/ParE family toxin [Marinilabilia salmonicolor]|jgi:plasmid stabilization system protein ParE|uniref:Plasmid stabilization system protein ParE n=1 Tax=Marinilabilia salmonicolor TaxID=989 RepID=A0A2T0XP01_9BACT|nr:type II toxin-antitoxin system RelE/ParE family toxin [Marinilabilia salmonicolor]PRZ00647.1 plasmid stabilization system protein ParE [Marinilabilia salmonicolor]RCW30839.1 plasmid stabilization system protein ParE [Marinilabilia salmonicolor]